MLLEQSPNCNSQGGSGEQVSPSKADEENSPGETKHQDAESSEKLDTADATQVIGNCILKTQIGGGSLLEVCEQAQLPEATEPPTPDTTPNSCINRQQPADTIGNNYQ